MLIALLAGTQGQYPAILAIVSYRQAQFTSSATRPLAIDTSVTSAWLLGHEDEL